MPDSLSNKPRSLGSKIKSRLSTHSSLSIEGNTLFEEQITVIIENKRVVGPEKDIIEVLNALEAYKHLNLWKPSSEKDFLKVHFLSIVHFPYGKR